MILRRRVVPLAGLVVVASCGGGGEVSGPGAVCGDGIFDREAEECDYSAGEEALIACPDGEAAGYVECDDTCHIVADRCMGTCGDGIVSATEECDGDSIEVEGRTCEMYGLSGQLSCTADCKETGCYEAGDAAVIEVTVNGQPLPDTLVAIADESGASVASTTTDATGRATYAVGANSIITIARTRTNGAKALISVADVDPGDMVSIALTDTMPGSTVSVGSERVTFSAPVIGTTNRSFAGCSSVTSSASSATPHSLNIYGMCTDTEGEAMLFAETLDGAGVPLGYHFQRDIAVTQGVPTDLTVSTWTQAYADLSCSLANAPAGDVNFNFDARFQLIPYSAYDQLVVATAGQSIVRSRPMPSAAFVDYVSCGLELDDGRQCSQRLTTPGTVNFDGAQFTTALSNLVLDTTMPARPSLSWTAGAASGDPDYVRGSLFFTSGTGSLGLTMYGPPSVTTLRASELPNNAQFAPYLPSSFALAPSSTNVRLEALGNVAGYKALIGRIGQVDTMQRVCSSVCYP